MLGAVRRLDWLLAPLLGISVSSCSAILDLERGTPVLRAEAGSADADASSDERTSFDGSFGEPDVPVADQSRVPDSTDVRADLAIDREAGADTSLDRAVDQDSQSDVLADVSADRSADVGLDDALSEPVVDAAPPCSPTTCPTGCCDPGGTCVRYAGQSRGQCGTAGAACAACGNDQACGAVGICECTAASCPGGCCQQNQCIPFDRQNMGTCGSAGNSCGACATGQACSNGACSCGGTSCSGCCSNSACLSPTKDHCGAGGASCVACQPTQDCSAQGICICNAQSCPNGCCDANGLCQEAGSKAACGTGGVACAACALDQACVGGQCVCNVQSCPTGCCDGNSCLPYPNQDTNRCGTNGATCASCAAGRACAKSSLGCVTWCGQQAIPSDVAAADYACLDFDDGLPSSTTWAPSIMSPSTLALTNAVSWSLPNSMEVGALIGLGGGDALIGWTAPTGAIIKKIAVTAAINVFTPQAGFGDAQVDLLCARLPNGVGSRACLAVGANVGLYVYHQFYAGAVHYAECPVAGNFVSNTWANVELRVNATTGLVEGVVGGTVTPCQSPYAPMQDNAAEVTVGTHLYLGAAQAGLTARYDNVVVKVER